MGICCMEREEKARSNYEDQIKDINERYHSKIKIKKLVNLIPETQMDADKSMITPRKSIKVP